ncbi:MAG: hypothetical protein R3Y54_09445 [Eubacteriales bacterium]
MAKNEYNNSTSNKNSNKTSNSTKNTNQNKTSNSYESKNKDGECCSTSNSESNTYKNC